MLDDFWITAAAGVVSFIVISLLRYLWRKYHNSRPKFLLSKIKHYSLPEKERGVNDHYAVVAIWNPSPVTIRKEDITEPIKIYARGASLKILAVTDGRMNKLPSQQDNYFHFDLDEIPAKAGLVVALNLCSHFMGVDGQVNNKPIYKYDDHFLPENLRIFDILDGAVMGLAVFLTVFSGMIAPEFIGVLKYFLPLILIIFLFRYPFNGFARLALKRIDMPEALQKNFNGQ